jgi:hemerythrin-like metal-binding protein
MPYTRLLEFRHGGCINPIGSHGLSGQYAGLGDRDQAGSRKEASSHAEHVGAAVRSRHETGEASMLLPGIPLTSGSTQDREFQRQHEEIFGRLTDVLEHEERSDRGRLVLAYDDFLACTRAHFAAEELLMAHCEPARLPAHKAAHEMILERAEQLRRRLEGLGNHRLLSELQIVESWLTDHCLDEGARLI